MPHLRLNQRNIEYAWYGPSPDQAPTLVFLHDGLGSVSTWRDFPARVAEATASGAFVYSRFGYGASDPVELPRPVTFMHDEARILPDLLKLVKIERPVLIGHSDGGSIALIYAGSGHPAHLLILEAPHVLVEDICVRSIAAAGDEYRRGEFKQRMARYHEDPDVAFWGWNQVWLDPEFRKWNIEEYLPNIKQPVLVIQGEQDEFGTERQLHPILKNCFAEILRLPDCGHSPHRDQPERTFNAMVDFIKVHVRGRLR